MLFMNCLAGVIQAQKRIMDENHPNTTYNNRSIDPNEGKSEDLKLISRWTRKALFPTVQFIFEPEEHYAVPDGYVYNMFYEDMKDRLVGVKLLQGYSDVEKDSYIVALWKEVTRKKTNIVTDGLNARRSAVYSAMQNRFTGTSLN